MKTRLSLLLSTFVGALQVYSATHTVKAGDNLYRIALNHGISVQELLAANQNSKVTALKIGQTLVIPSKGQKVAIPVLTRDKSVSPSPTTTGIHVIAAGDTLSSIARSRGISVTDLQKLNPSINPSAMKIGQQIKVAGKKITSSPETAPVIVKNPPVQERTVKPKPDIAKQSISNSDTENLTNHTQTISIPKSPRQETPRHVDQTPGIPIPAAKENTAAPKEVEVEVAVSMPVVEKQLTPAQLAAQSAAQRNSRLARITRPITLGEFAAENSVSVEELNFVNGWDNYPSTMALVEDSEVLIPAQP